MMGTQQRRASLFVLGFELGSRIPPDHPLRAIDAHVDFSFVRGEVVHLYGRNGNVSVDPEVILKMMVLLFYYDIKSERELMRVLQYRLDFQWFLGYTLDDTIPDHSVLSKARKRWGPAVFESLFVRTVAQCVGAGLVDGTTVHLDGSLVDADASNASVLKGPPAVLDAFRRIYIDQEAKLSDLAESTPDEPSDEDADDGEDDAWPPAALTAEPTEEESERYERVNKGLLSTTDPDATVVRKGHQKPHLRYKNHRAVDDAYGVITATITTSGDGKENGQMMPLVDQHEHNTGMEVETAVADSQYGTVENFRACGQRGIRSHMADLATTHKDTGRRKGIFDESHFVYDPATDTYRCPAGQTLTRRRHRTTRRAYEYTAGPKVCGACPLRSQCTRAKKAGRTLKRHEDHDAIEAARAESASAAAKRDRRRRKHLMEGSFADAANNHGFKRSRWRRLWRQQIQDYLIAAVQNIRILLRHGRLRESGTQVRAGGFTAAARHSVLTFWRALWAVVWAIGATVASGWAIDPASGR
jgi:transposase